MYQGNQIRQQEVSSWQPNKTSFVLTAAPYHLHYHLSSTSCQISSGIINVMHFKSSQSHHTHIHVHGKIVFHKTDPWCQKDWGLLAYGVDSHSLLHGIFLTQGWNPGLLHCRQIFYCLSHQGSPRIMEWVSLSLLQGIIPTQESNQGLLHCRQILYHLRYQGSP